MLMFPLVAAKASGAPDTSTTAAAIRIFFISVASKYKTSSQCFCRPAVRVGVDVEARRHYRTFTSFVTDECRRPRILQRNVSDARVTSVVLSIVRRSGRRLGAENPARLAPLASHGDQDRDQRQHHCDRHHRPGLVDG